MVHITSTQHLRTTVAARLVDRIDELVDAVCSAVFAEVAPYQRLALPSSVGAFRADVRGSLDAYVRTVADGRPLRKDELERLGRLGARRARQGIPADAVADALEAAMRACWQYIRDATLTHEDARVAAEVLAQLADEAFGLLKTATDAMMAGHAAELGRGTHAQTRATADVVARMVDGTWRDERELRRAVRALGADLERHWALLLLTPPSQAPTVDLDRRAGDLLACLDTRTALLGASRAVPTAHVPLLVPTDDDHPPTDVVEAAAAAATEVELLVLVPNVAWAWTALPHAYRNHVEAIVCARAATRNGGVVTEAECAVYRLLQALPLSQRVDYVRSVLGPVLQLPPTKSREALATLDAYFRGNGRLDETAADLQLHRNSFRYRLDRAQTLLGVNFRQGLDRMRVELALALRRLDREEAALLEPADTSSPPAPGARTGT